MSRYISDDDNKYEKDFPADRDLTPTDYIPDISGELNKMKDEKPDALSDKAEINEALPQDTPVSAPEVNFTMITSPEEAPAPAEASDAPASEAPAEEKKTSAYFYQPWQDTASSVNVTKPSSDDFSYSPNYHDTASLRFVQQMPNTEKSTAVKKTKSKKGVPTWLKIVALILCCAIAAGAAAACVTSAMIKKIDVNPVVTNQVVLGSDDKTAKNYDEEIAAIEAAERTANAVGVYALACEQVVGIQTDATTTNIFGQTTTGPAVSGSGFVISSDGYIVTNYHVIEYAAVYGSANGYELKVIMNDGTSYPAEIIGYEQDNDIAVLKIETSGLNAVSIGTMSNVAVGSCVYAVGNPLGELEYTMTSGIVSALDRVITTEESTDINMFQIDCAINSGNSGGPVYNDSGEVIGIVTAKYSNTGVEGIGFAIPIDDAMHIISELIEHGYVTGKAYMSVMVRTVTSQVAQYYNLVEGALVDTVNEGGAAEKAGIEKGDIIIALGGEEIKSIEDLKSVISAYSAGDTASITVYRNGEELELSITFDEEKPQENTSSQQQTQQEQQQQTIINPFSFFGNSGGQQFG